MRKEQTLLVAQHIENTTFEHWWSVHGLYANNMVIDGLIKEEKDKEEKDKGKELALAVFSRTCNRCGCQGHKEAECYVKKHMNGQTLTPKIIVVAWDQTMITTAKIMARKRGSRGIATIAENSDTRR